MIDLSNRKFKVWAYTVSHSFLILRSPLVFEDVEGYNESLDFNIDIEFTSVIYIDIPNILSGIRITEIKSDIPQKFCSYIKDPNNKLFEIESNGSYFYIVAGGYLIGKNKWFSEDRISNMSLKYDEILASS